MIKKPRYRIALSNNSGEIDVIETNNPGIMLAEVIRQKLAKDWQYIQPGDTIRITDNDEE